MKRAQFAFVFALVCATPVEAKPLAAIGVVPNFFDDNAKVSVAYEFTSPTPRQNAVVVLMVRDGTEPDAPVIYTDSKIASFPPRIPLRVTFGPIDAVGRKASSIKLAFSAIVIGGPEQVGLQFSSARTVRTKVCKAAGGSRDSKVRQVCIWQTFRDPKITGKPPQTNPLP